MYFVGRAGLKVNSSAALGLQYAIGCDIICMIFPTAPRSAVGYDGEV